MKNLKSRAFRFVVYTTLLCMLFLSTTLQSIASTNVKVYFNGKLMEFGTSANDPAPYIKEGRTLIPFRRIFEALGMDVGWDPVLRMVTAKGNGIEMTLYIGGKIAIVNGEEKELDVPAEITDDRTFVPLRFVSENCGAVVAWDDSTKSVYITMPITYRPLQEKYCQPSKEKVWVVSLNIKTWPFPLTKSLSKK